MLALQDTSPPSTIYDGKTPAPSLDALRENLGNSNTAVKSLESLLGDVDRLACELSASTRTVWLHALHEYWSRRHWAFSTEHLASLLALTIRWCDWPLARKVGTTLAKRRSLNCAETLALVDACLHIGDLDTAIELTTLRQLGYPSELEFSSCHEYLLEYKNWRDRNIRQGDIDGDDDDLQLEPMGHHHLPDFAWQYHDPAIAERCCLPTFENDAQWHRWLDAIYNCGDQQIHAVIHREWGFIGSVSLILHEGIGFFYYWFGPDFQGQGYGPRAVTLMLASAAERYGLHTCYAKVYEDNIPSRRALEKLGFEDIQVCAVAPDNDEVFYRRGPLADRGRIAEELHWLLAAMNSGTRPAILLQHKC